MKRLLIHVRWYEGEACCLCILCIPALHFRFAPLFGFISQKMCLALVSNHKVSLTNFVLSKQRTAILKVLGRELRWLEWLIPIMV